MSNDRQRFDGREAVCLPADYQDFLPTHKKGQNMEVFKAAPLH